MTTVPSGEGRPHYGDPPENDPESRRSSPIRLLLVDDEEAYVNVLFNRLGRRGFHVTKTYSGGEALQKMRGNEFDVAVLDLKMADMDGIEVLKVLKVMDPHMQVIMLTGHGSATACRQGLELGAFDYLTKPCELDDLVGKIKAAFRKKEELAAQ
jgi:DNA-binding response OmpR family regulator